MKTNWIKLSTFFLGATLVLSSCVKNEESDEVKDLRKAAAAKLNADAAYRQAEVKLQNAAATFQQYQTKRDSAKYLTDITTYEAQAQLTIQEAKNGLLTKQIAFDKNTKDLQVQLLSNPVLLALVNDYDKYYNGGTLTDNRTVVNGIFGLQNKILSEQATIIGLQSTKDGLVYLQKKKEIDLVASEIKLADLQARLKILGDARSTGDFSSAITAAQTLVAKSAADSVKLTLAYDNALNLSELANTLFGIASKLYDQQGQTVGFYKNGLHTGTPDDFDGYMEIIAPYSTSDEEKADYDAMILAQTNATALEARNMAVLNTMTAKYNAALAARNTAQTNYNSALATQAAAQAIVDAKLANGETPTTTESENLTNANTAVTNADDALNNATTGKETLYAAVNDEYQTAKTDYDNSKEDLDDIRDKVAKYNELKAAFTTEDSKLPALMADRDAKKATYYKLVNSTDSINALHTTAVKILKNDRAAVTLLTNDRNRINTAIDNLEKEINTTNEAIATLTTDIANLTAGIDIDGTGSDKYVGEQIAISEAKIAEWEGLLTKYQAAADALKVKIDAQ